MLFWLVGFAEGVPHRKADSCSSRHIHASGYLGNESQAHGGNARCFDCSLNQSDRPVAHRSTGAQHGHVHPGIDQELGDFWGCFIRDLGRVGVETHETNVN